MIFKRKTRLLIIIPSLKISGAERLILNIINNIDKDKFLIYLCVIFRDESSDFLLYINKKFRLIYLDDVDSKSNSNSTHVSKNRDIDWIEITSKKIFSLIKYHHIDVCFANMVYTTIFCIYNELIAKNVRLISEFDTNIDWVYKKSSINGFVEKLFKEKINNTDLVITYTAKQKLDLQMKYKLTTHKIMNIPPMININAIRELSQENVEFDWFNENYEVLISVSRLEEPKRIDLLINAFSNLINSGRDLRLLILGEGSEKDKYMNLGKELNIFEKIRFLGYSRNPYKYLSRSSIFVMCSDFEGAGQVIIESMVCGCPVVSTNIDYGPAEILENGKYGVLVEPNDVFALTKGIEQLLDDVNLRKKFIKLGKERCEDYSIDKNIKLYERIFENKKESHFFTSFS